MQTIISPRINWRLYVCWTEAYEGFVIWHGRGATVQKTLSYFPRETSKKVPSGLSAVTCLSTLRSWGGQGGV